MGDHALVVIFLVLLTVIAWAYWRRSRALGQSSRNEVDIEVRACVHTRVCICGYNVCGVWAGVRGSSGLCLRVFENDGLMHRSIDSSIGR